MDGKDILPDSIGAPFVIILNESSKPILDRYKKDISDLVTNFSYKYDEEDDDECDITIETDDETLPDNPALSEDKYIIVQWGVRMRNGTEKISPKRKVMVRDHTWDLSTNGYVLSLKCTDGYSSLRGEPIRFSNSTGSGSMGNPLLDKVLEALYGNFDYVTVPMGYSTQSTMYGLSTPSVAGAQYFVTDKELGRKTVMIVGIPPGTTTHNAIDNMALSKEGGPYHVSGRDDNVVVSKVNFKKNPMGQFTWKGGEGDLLSWRLQTSRKKVEVTSSEASGLDEDKKLTKTTVQALPEESSVPSMPISLAESMVNGHNNLFKSTMSDKNISTLRGVIERDRKLNKSEVANETDYNKFNKYYLDNPNATEAETKAYVRKLQEWQSEADQAVENGSPAGIDKPLPEFTIKRKQKVQVTVPVYDYRSGDLNKVEKSLQTGQEYDPKIWSDKDVYKKKIGNPNFAVRQKTKDGILREAEIQGWSLDEVSQETFNPNEGLMGGRYSERQPRTMTFSKYVYRDVKIDIRKAFTSPAGAVAFKGILGNAIQSGYEKKKQVDCKILGDPSITCSEVLLFYGVGKLYEGKYWLKTASHTINRYNGYTVQLELVGETVKPRFNTVQYERSVSDMQQRYSKALGYTNYRTTDLRHKAKSKLLIEAQEEFNKNPDVQSLIYVIKSLDEDANGKLILDHDEVKLNEYNDLNQATKKQTENMENTTNVSKIAEQAREKVLKQVNKKK